MFFEFLLHHHEVLQAVQSQAVLARDFQADRPQVLCQEKQFGHGNG